MPSFLETFGAYLAQRYGWSMSAGPISAIRTHSRSSTDAWLFFWKLLDDFRAHYVASKVGAAP